MESGQLRFIYIFLYFHLLHYVNGLWLGECNWPLGLSTGRVPDSALTASSSHDMIVGPHRARLGREDGGGAWCPRGMVDKKQLEYIEVNFGTQPVLVTGIGTQGRFANNFGVEYTPGFTVEFARPEDVGGAFQPYAFPRGSNETVVFVGNSDTYTEIRNEFYTPILASRVRIRPISVHPRVVCLRFELYGCAYTDGLDYYKIEGRNERYYASEGVLYDGRVTTSLLLEEEASSQFPSADGGDFQGKSAFRAKRATDGTKSSNGNSSRSKVDESRRNLLSGELVVDPQLSGPWLNGSDEASLSNEGLLKLPIIPPGEVVAPELPLNLKLEFYSARNFSKMFVYADPIHPLIAGAQPTLNVSVSLGHEDFSSRRSLEMVTLSLENEALNLSIDARGLSASTIWISFVVDHAEVNLQEIYFVSVPCGCDFEKKEFQPKRKKEPLSPSYTTVNSSKISKSATYETKIDKSTKTFLQSTSEPARQSWLGTEDEMLSLGDNNSIGLKPFNVAENKVTTVWAVHTATTHKAYVGVAVGFSIGAMLLLLVWIYLWIRSSASKVSSPRMFRRSVPRDTLDMAYLMDGSLTDFGIQTPMQDDNTEVVDTFCRHTIRSGTGGTSSMSTDSFRYSNSNGLGKLQDDLSTNYSLISPVPATSMSSLPFKKSVNRRSFTFGPTFFKSKSGTQSKNGRRRKPYSICSSNWPIRTPLELQSPEVAFVRTGCLEVPGRTNRPDDSFISSSENLSRNLEVNSIAFPTNDGNRPM